ncbi:sensor domain-containing diguanylate cyclase [Sphingomonas hengshuiensis]|uniref:diguanylate cyclase n=1 Tax=Sphingomonas hengshuiensis TaxID=1609977 RepID=A0A7U5BG01_9SPHN|nr:diguanylate cyclase [Sphingomonas hengshuiensis]AJP74571.1 signal peptide protein [Sphingomonas hengshuiensis]
MFVRFWPRFLRLMVASLALYAAARPAIAEASAAGSPLDLCILRDTGGMRPAALFHQPQRFDCTTPQHKLGTGDFWVLSSPIDRQSLESDPLRVRLASVWQERLTLHILYADGEILSMATGRTGVAPFIQLGAVVEQPLPARPAKVVRLLWHVEKSPNMRGILFGARLATADQSRAINLRMAALYAGFAGLCLALVMYNLALWGALRHRFQLDYCVMVAALMLYTFTSSGAMSWAFPGLANNDRLRFNYLLLGLASAAAIMFARNFFEPRIFAGWLKRYSTGVALATSGAGLSFFLLAPVAPRVPDIVFTLAFLGLATVVGPILWRGWRQRSSYVWLFAVGWGLPILMALLRTLSNLHVLPWSFWIDNSTIVSATSEALMSAIAIAYRIRLLRDERDDAIAAEVMARRLADTDPLTGLLNRRAFLNKAIAREGDQQLLVVDIDHFKRVNETLGHDGGDEVLRVFARVMRTTLPAQTLVARMGGEEFAILTPAESAIEPDALLARLRNARMPFDLRVTASIGACVGPLVTDRDWKALYRGADAALFEAKSAGRDRFRTAVRRAA